MVFKKLCGIRRAVLESWKNTNTEEWTEGRCFEENGKDLSKEWRRQAMLQNKAEHGAVLSNEMSSRCSPLELAPR